jgi:hypothetical protein
MSAHYGCEMLVIACMNARNRKLARLIGDLQIERRDDPLSFLKELNAAIYDWFDYVPKATRVDSPIDHAIEARMSSSSAQPARRPSRAGVERVESRKGAVPSATARARFPSPLIKPDGPFSSIRLSDRIHHQLTEGFATKRRSTPSFPNTTRSEYLAVPSEGTLWRRLRNTLTDS